MLFKNINYVDQEFNVIKNTYIGIKEDRIVYVSEDFPIDRYEEEIDGTNMLLLPGLINTHCHVPMTLMRNYAEELPLDKWLNEKIFPFEDKLTPSATYYGSMVGIMEMLSSGVTSFSDMYMGCQSIIEAVTDSGIKANISWGITTFEDIQFKDTNAYQFTIENINQYDDKIRIDTAIHAEYTNNKEAIVEVNKYSKDNNRVVQIHISETKLEHDNCKNKYHMTPTQFFNSLNTFDNKVVLAHCVHLEAEDFKILRDSKASIAHCPSSNLKLGSGIADVKKMLEYGINVTIGTDGAASNNNLNMLEELHLASLLQKGYHQDPLVLPPKEILKMATVNGAIAQNRLDTGVIKVGNKADLFIINFNKPHLLPVNDMLSAVIYSAQASDVYLTMVDGKILYKEGRFTSINSSEILDKFNKEVESILVLL